MGSLIFPWKDVVYACLILFLVLNNFVLLLMSFHLLQPTRTAELLYSSIHLFRSLFALWRVFAYLLVCLHMWAFRSIIFISSSYVFVIQTHKSSFLFVCLCAGSVYKMSFMSTETKTTKATDAAAAVTDWINMFVQLLACFFVDATVQYNGGTNF